MSYKIAKKTFDRGFHSAQDPKFTWQFGNLFLRKLHLLYY
jgi:hypothetical protein